MMKSNMISFIVTLCVLLAFHEEMIVDAGRLNKIKNIMKPYDKDMKKLHKCCAKIKCFRPDQCIATSLSRMKCRCIKM